MSANKTIIDSIRSRFLSTAEQQSDKFHASDVERVRTDDWTVQRYVIAFKTEEEAFKTLVHAMKWRNELGVNDFTDDYFPEEIYKLGLYNVSHKDREGRPIFWINNRVYRKSELTKFIKKYMVYLVDKIDRQCSSKEWVIFTDFTDSGILNVDMSYGKFIAEVTKVWFPCRPTYTAYVNLSAYLSAPIKLFISLSQGMRDSNKIIIQDELPQYMEEADIPIRLGGAYNENVLAIADGVKPLVELTHHQYSSKQIEKIYGIFGEIFNKKIINQ